MSALSVNELCEDLSKKRNSALLSLIFNHPISPIHLLKINKIIREEIADFYSVSRKIITNVKLSTKKMAELLIKNLLIKNKEVI